MSLELVSTAGSLVTVVIVATATIAALVQLRHLRTGNQINAILTIGEAVSAKPFQDALYLVVTRLAPTLDDPTFRDYEIAISRRVTPPEVPLEYAQLRRAAIHVGNTFAEFGILVKNGIVEKSLFLDQYSTLVVAVWKWLRNYTAFNREAAGIMSTWESFEYLAVLSEDWMKQHPSLYPKGVRRLQIRNPWPIPPAPVPSGQNEAMP